MAVTAVILTAACSQPPSNPACDDPLGCLFLAPDAPLEIGVLLTTNGDTAFLGRDALGAIELVLKEHDRMWLDHPLVLQGADGRCSFEGGTEAADELLNNSNLVAIIGPSCAATARAALPAIDAAGLILLSPSATAPDLTEPAQAGGVAFFRTIHNDLAQGRLAARYALDVLRASTAATIYDRRRYSTELQQAFADTFQDGGGNIVFQGALDASETNLENILGSIAADAADVLYFPLFEPEAGSVVRNAADQLGLEETVLLSSDGIFVDGFPENTGPAAAGVLLTAPHLGGAQYNAFLAGWVAEYGVLPSAFVHAFAYDATQMLLDAIASAAVVGDDRSLLIGRQALRDALHATTNFPGLTGSLTCTPEGECASGATFGIYQIGPAEISEGNWPPPVIWSPPQ